MPRLKICGLTTLADLGLALRVGADFVGAIVDIARSPRSVPPEVASFLLRAARGRGVVVTDRPDAGWLPGLLRAACPAAVQLHAEPSAESVACLRSVLPPCVELWAVLSIPVEPAVAADAVSGLMQDARRLARAGVSVIVLDSKVGGVSGGTGIAASWSLAAQIVAASPLPVLLAGGITPQNAVAALAASSAAGLDVSSGVERCPGRKDPARMAAICQQLKA
jgi:phosphoribosylanthranilate isomerase